MTSVFGKRPRLALSVLPFLLLWPLTALAEGECWSPPQLSSDEVRSRRPSTAEDAVVFDMEEDVLVPGKAPKSTKSSIVLAPSYTLQVTGNSSSLDDYILCRNYTWMGGEKNFHSLSLYALPAFFEFELANRGYLAKTLGAAKSDKAPPSPYWAEAELHVQNEPVDRLTSVRGADGVDYRLGSEVVTRVTGEAGTMSDDEMRRVIRFLARSVPLHPQVRRDLKGGKTLPSRLEMVGRSTGTEETEILTIGHLRRESIAYPLPTERTSDIRDPSTLGDAAMQRGVSEALLAADGKSTVPKPDLKSLMDAMQEAGRKGPPLQVLLLLFQFTQEYPTALNGPDGPSLLAEIKPLFGAALKDATAARFWHASELAGASATASGREAAARSLAETRTDGLSFGTFRYVTFANLVRGSNGVDKWDQSILKSMPSPLTDNYWMHIAEHPWSSNTYKDAGDAYLAGLDISNAWLAYDLGRTVDANWRSGVMKSQAALEQRLREALPDFF